MTTADVERLCAQIERELPETWVEWPGGWPGEIEVALLDAVFSIQSRYAGVRNVIGRWRGHRGPRPLDDLGYLAAFADAPGDLVAILGNRQMVPGRSATKAGAVTSAATRLVAAQVCHADELDVRNDAHRRAYVGVPGLGEVTWTYLGMLLGQPGVKADTMIQRFVSRSQSRKIDAVEARALVERAASQLDRPVTTVDHAIWSYERTRNGV